MGDGAALATAGATGDGTADLEGGIEGSDSFNDLCNFDSFVWSRSEPCFFVLDVFSTRTGSCDLKERLNMVATGEEGNRLVRV